MIGTIDLYQLKLTKQDTLHFSNKNLQKVFFDGQTKVTFNNISYNMSREIRIEGNAFGDMIKYSYARYTYEDNTLYFFVNNIRWVNDNIIALDVELDYFQSFCIDLDYSVGQVNSRTLHYNLFRKQFIPYSNKFPVSDYGVTAKQTFSDDIKTVITQSNFETGFIVVNVDESITSANGFPILTENNYTEMGYIYPYITLVFPIAYSYKDGYIYDYPHTNGGLRYGSITAFERFINKYGAYVKNVALTFTPVFNSLVIANDGIRERDNNSKTGGGEVIRTLFVDDYSIIQCSIRNGKIVKRFHIGGLPDNRALWCTPYSKLVLGTFAKNLTINLQDYVTKDYSSKAEYNGCVATYFQSLAFPFQSNFSFKINGEEIQDENLVFNLDCATLLPYDVSKWSEYYSNYSASVNDGLATKHYYDGINLALNTGSKALSGVLNIGIGASMGVKGASSIATGATQVLDSVVGVGTTINNMEKEKALLELSWNDVKSAPDQSVNYASIISILLASKTPKIELYTYVAKNISDINILHRIYGYQVNRHNCLIGGTDYTPYNVQTHIDFDFVSYELMTIKTPMPQWIRENIIDMFRNGLRIWWDYTDKFGDLTYPNIATS